MIKSNDFKIILIWPLQHFFSRSVTGRLDSILQKKIQRTKFYKFKFKRISKYKKLFSTEHDKQVFKFKRTPKYKKPFSTEHDKQVFHKS